jgi:hypothetical protein
MLSSEQSSNTFPLVINWQRSKPKTQLCGEVTNAGMAASADSRF